MRRYFVTTFGCQMNAHDSERIKGLLEELGLGGAVAGRGRRHRLQHVHDPEKPDTKFASYIGEALAQKRRRPDTVIAVGGCYAEAQRDRLFTLYPGVDVAFGPGSIPHLGDWLGRRPSASSAASSASTSGRSPPSSPSHRERGFQRGCRSRWAATRSARTASSPVGSRREVSRRPGEIVAEVARLAGEGVKEITLLGQNVNSYGRDVGSDFAELLRACDDIDGIERIRFTSPHPKDFRRPVIDAMAECASVCEHAHLPLQSGSTRLLKLMRRTYSRERFVRLATEMRATIPRSGR